MPPLFLADEMLAKLVRFMRVFGIPVDYVEGKTDDQIMLLAKKRGYALLTSDEELVRRCRKRSITALYLPQATAEKQVALVLLHFRLKLPPFPSATLCPKCGGKLLKASKSELKGKVYSRVLSRRRFFWRCSKCSHIYWSGTHYERLRRARYKVRRLMS
jgi:uncharacterized protein with PIN domain